MCGVGPASAASMVLPASALPGRVLGSMWKTGVQMTTNADDSNTQKPTTGRSLVVRQAAARSAITASKRTGRPVDEQVQRMANPG